MPNQLNLFDVLLGRSRPNPDMKPVFTPQDQVPPNVLDPAIDFVRGLGYFPTDPLPSDVGGAYGAGAMVAAGAPLAGAFGKWRPAINELKDIIGSHTLADPMREALLSRVTPSKVFHRTPINVPEGFEIPTEFGPNYTERPQHMSDRYILQREIPIPQQKQTRALNPSGVNSSKRLQTYEAPSAANFGEAKAFAKPNATPPERKSIIGGGSIRRKQMSKSKAGK